MKEIGDKLKELEQRIYDLPCGQCDEGERIEELEQRIKIVESELERIAQDQVIK